MPPPGPRRRRRRRRLARAAKAVLAVAGLGGGLYLTASLVANAAVDLEAVARWVEPRTAAALSGTVTIDGTGVTLLPRPSLDARGVTVQSAGPGGDPSVRRVARVRLQLDPLALVTGKLRVARVVLDGPVLSFAAAETVDLSTLLARSSQLAVDPADPAPTPDPRLPGPATPDPDTGSFDPGSPPPGDTAFH